MGTAISPEGLAKEGLDRRPISGKKFLRESARACL